MKKSGSNKRAGDRAVTTKGGSSRWATAEVSILAIDIGSSLVPTSSSQPPTGSPRPYGKKKQDVKRRIDEPVTESSLNILNLKKKLTVPSYLINKAI